MASLDREVRLIYTATLGKVLIHLGVMPTIIVHFAVATRAYARNRRYNALAKELKSTLQHVRMHEIEEVKSDFFHYIFPLQHVRMHEIEEVSVILSFADVEL